MHHPPANFIELGGHRIIFDPQSRGGFVDQVDRLVRQKSLGDVSIGQNRRRDDRAVGDADAMVGFVALLEAAQNGDRVFNARLIDRDRLKPPFQGRVFVDVLLVFVERGGADGPQLATRQRRLEQVAGIHRSFGLARADDGMQFVDEEDDLSVALRDFFDDGFEAILKFAAELRAGDQCPHVQRDDPLVFEHGRHVAIEHADRQAFDDRGFTHARLADQHGVVLRSAGQAPASCGGFLRRDR